MHVASEGRVDTSGSSQIGEDRLKPILSALDGSPHVKKIIDLFSTLSPEQQKSFLNISPHDLIKTDRDGVTIIEHLCSLCHEASIHYRNPSPIRGASNDILLDRRFTLARGPSDPLPVLTFATGAEAQDFTRRMGLDSSGLFSGQYADCVKFGYHREPISTRFYNSGPLQVELYDQLSFEDGQIVYDAPRKGVPNYVADDVTRLEQGQTVGGTYANAFQAEFTKENIVARGHFVVSNQPLTQLLSALASPATSTQDAHNTCGPETISYILDMVDTGEWVRIAKELMLTGSSTTRNYFANDRLTLRIPSDFEGKDVIEKRSLVDAIMQAAIKNAVAPEGMEYSNKRDCFVNLRTGETEEPGIDDHQAQRALNALLDTTHVQFTESDRETFIGILKGKPGFLYTALRWGSPSPVDGAVHDAHAIAVTHLDKEGRVHFRNPWGPSDRKPGQELDNPPRRVENPETGEESMDVKVFRELFQGAVISREVFESAIKSNAASMLSANPNLMPTVVEAIRVMNVSHDQRQALYQISKWLYERFTNADKTGARPVEEIESMFKGISPVWGLKQAILDDVTRLYAQDHPWRSRFRLEPSWIRHIKRELNLAKAS